MSRVRYAEWTKLRTEPAARRLVPSLVEVTVLMRLFAVASASCTGGGCGIDPAVLGCVAVGRAVLPGNGIAAPSLTDGPTLRATVGSVLYLVLVALLALGVTAAVRNAAASAGAVLALLYAVPLIAAVINDPELRRTLRRFAPMPAGLAVQATTDLERLPIGPWAGLSVLAAWSAAALLCGGLALRLHDP